MLFSNPLRCFFCAMLLSLVSFSGQADEGICNSSSGAPDPRCPDVLTDTTTWMGARSERGTAVGAIDVHGKCRYIDNISPEGDFAVFVPFRTGKEWLAFIDAAEVGTNLQSRIKLDYCARAETQTVPCSAGCSSSHVSSFNLPYARIGTRMSFSTSYSCPVGPCGAEETLNVTFTAYNSDDYPVGESWKVATSEDKTYSLFIKPYEYMCLKTKEIPHTTLDADGNSVTTYTYFTFDDGLFCCNSKTHTCGLPGDYCPCSKPCLVNCNTGGDIVSARCKAI